MDNNEARWVVGLTVGLLVLHITLRDSSLEELTAKTPYWLRSLILALMILSIIFLPTEGNRAFIYYQF